MDGLREYFAMGGYAAFIWPAYLIAVVVLVGLLAVSLRDLRRNENLAQALRQQRRAAPESEAET
jgi:heme exporter protein D